MSASAIETNGVQGTPPQDQNANEQREQPSQPSQPSQLTQNAGSEQEQQTDSKDLSKQPQWVQTLVADLRREAGDARTNAKAAAAEEARNELAQEIGKALGLVKGDETVTPEQLSQQVTAAQAETQEAKRELAVFKLAGAAGADPDALLDSNSFMKSLAGLAPDETEKIAAAIKDAVSKNSKLSAGPRAGTRSGGDAGGSGERTVTKEAFDKMSGSEKNKLYQTDPDLYARLSSD